MQGYRTVSQEASRELIQKRSRFIGQIRPVSSEEEAAAFIQQVKAQYWDASHHVYAYRLRQGQTQRYSDDGEPQGTAGLPVLEVLSKSDTTDVVVVVTRYFGGVLLGTGGLVHAYSGTARLALEAAGPVERIPCLTASLVCSYSQYGKVAALIPAAGGTVDDTLFTAGVELRFTIEPHQLPLLNRQLADATRGEVQAQATGECFISRPVV